MKFVAIDLQNDFISKGGIWYQNYPCVDFIKNDLIPYFSKTNHELSQIISDYELPRMNGSCSYCIPNTWGYNSIVPKQIIKGETWIKATRSPNWVRNKNGLHPIIRPDLFTKWLVDNIGDPNSKEPVILMGVSLDCCVLCVAQEMYFRGYNINFLYEGVDFSFQKSIIKDNFIHEFVSVWGKVVYWQEIKEFILQKK